MRRTQDKDTFFRCFYFATKTATSIGKNKKPTNVAEIVFMTASWLMGVFVFAILIGDIRDIVSNARVNILTYQKHLDAITAYMNNNKVARRVQVLSNLAFCVLLKARRYSIITSKMLSSFVTDFVL